MTQGEALPEIEEGRHRVALALSPDTASGDEVLALLGDSSWRVRRAALSRLEHFGHRADIVTSLITGLGDPDNAGLRSACAEALGRLGEPAVPELVRALGGPDVDRRKFIVEVLGGIGTRAARESLVATLDDGDENVRSAVIDALGRLGDPAAVGALRARLAAARGDAQVEAFVLYALGQLGAQLAFEEIEPYLGRAELARQIAPLLGACVDERAVARLVDAVASGTRSARGQAIRALGHHGARLDAARRERLREQLEAAPAVIAILREALEDPDDGVAEAATFTLGIVRDPSDVPRILGAAASRPHVKSAVDAVRPLGARVVAPLLATLDGAPTEARVLALEVIESFGDASAVPQLLRVARGVELRAAEAAVSALGKLAGPECIEPLMEIARSGEPDLLRQTALALAGVGMRHPGEVASVLRQALDCGDLRPVWIVVLGVIGRAADRTAIVAASHHRDPEVRRAALEAFVTYGVEIDEDVVVLALTDENAGVRAAAARALGAYRSERAADALLVSMGDTDQLVVAEALRALGSVGGTKATGTLLSASASSSAPVAIAALQSLFRLRPPGLQLAVERALGHADPEVVREAVVLTMRLGPETALSLLLRCLQHRSWHVRLAAVEMLNNRDLAVAEEVILSHLDDEREPLVVEALERLAKARGARR